GRRRGVDRRAVGVGASTVFSMPGRSVRVARLENGEDADRGRQARKAVPRSSHGDWAPAAGRPDPVQTLHVQAESRLAELVPIRYGRMLASPFTFYRGAAAVMAADLAETPASGLVVQACGDAHISNFGWCSGQTISTRRSPGRGNGT